MMQSTKNSSLVDKVPHLVFYDDACPLCSKEINHYRKLEACHPINWVPLHQEKSTVESFGFSKNDLLERLHVVRGDGVVVTGASAGIPSNVIIGLESLCINCISYQL